ncbi:MAG TPA: acyltransferase [Acidothermaceae bacterium]|jgi:fucose 4-O-acetylase-like acetyltransferase
MEAAPGTDRGGVATSRNTYLDLIRVVAIAAVVIGHWIATGITYKHGQLDGVDVLGVSPWTSWLTLIFQVVPLFFLVGGYSNALSWTRYQAAGGSGFGWTRRRARRLLVPTAGYVAAISLAVVACTAAGANRDDLHEAGWALSLHLWFLAPYLLLLLLTPTLLAFHRRCGVAVPIVMAATAVVIDAGYVEEHWRFVGWANYLLVWGTFHQLGFAWQQGFLTGRRGRALVLASGSIVVLVALIWWGPYPVSMVGVPGARIQNASPPSAALLAFGLAQVGMVLLASSSVSAWLARPASSRLRDLIQRANAMTMPVYLWHMVPVVIVAVIAYPNHWFAQPPIGSRAWWAQRIPWVAALTLVLAGVLALIVLAARLLNAGRSRRPDFGHKEAQLAHRESLGRRAMLGLGVAVSVATLGRLAVWGFAPNGSLDAITVGCFAVGVLLVLAAGAYPRTPNAVGRSVRGELARASAVAPADVSAPPVAVAGRVGVPEPGASPPPHRAS